MAPLGRGWDFRSAFETRCMAAAGPHSPGYVDGFLFCGASGWIDMDHVGKIAVCASTCFFVGQILPILFLGNRGTLPVDHHPGLQVAKLISSSFQSWSRAEHVVLFFRSHNHIVVSQ